MKVVIKDQWWRGIKERGAAKQLPGGKPEGWTQESIASAFDSLGGTFQSCVDNVSGVEDPQAFCAWLKSRATGETPGSEAWRKEAEAGETVLTISALEASCPECARFFRQRGIAQITISKEKMAQWRSAVAQISGPQYAKKPVSGAARPPAKKEDYAGPAVVGHGTGLMVHSIRERIDVLKSGATANFEIAMVAKAVEENGKWFIEGVASDDRVDKDGERMSTSALQKMVASVNSGEIPLIPTHKSDEWDDEMSRLGSARLTDKNELYVRYELDKEIEKAQKLWKALTEKGKKLGLSIGGMVSQAFQEFDEKAGKVVRVIDDIVLKHIAVTGRPANPRAWVAAIAKAIDWETALKEAVAERRKEKMPDPYTPVARAQAGGGTGPVAGTAADPALHGPSGGVAPEAMAYDYYKMATRRHMEAESGGMDDEMKEAKAMKEAAAQAFKSAIKARLIKEGKNDDEADEEADRKLMETEEEAKAERKRKMEAHGKQSSETVTVTMTKAQFASVKPKLDELEVKESPVYQNLSQKVEELTKTIKTLTERRPGQPRGLQASVTAEEVTKTWEGSDVIKSDAYKKASINEQKNMLMKQTVARIQELQKAGLQ